MGHEKSSMSHVFSKFTRNTLKTLDSGRSVKKTFIRFSAKLIDMCGLYLHVYEHHAQTFLGHRPVNTF